MDAFYHAAPCCDTISARPSLRHTRTVSSSSYSVVEIPFRRRRQKSNYFLFQNFPNSLLLPLFLQLLLLNALGIPLSSSQLPPVRVIREPLDLFHFVGLPALLFHLLSSRGWGVKLDCGKNKLLIKQIDTRTISFLSSTKGGSRTHPGSR